MTRITRRVYPAVPIEHADVILIVNAYLQRIEERGTATQSEIRDMRILNPRYFAEFFFAKLMPRLDRVQIQTHYGHYWRYKVSSKIMAESAVPF